MIAVQVPFFHKRNGHINDLWLTEMDAKWRNDGRIYFQTRFNCFRAKGSRNICKDFQHAGLKLAVNEETQPHPLSTKEWNYQNSTEVAPTVTRNMYIERVLYLFRGPLVMAVEHPFVGKRIDLSPSCTRRLEYKSGQGCLWKLARHLWTLLQWWHKSERTQTSGLCHLKRPCVGEHIWLSQSIQKMDMA